MDESLRELVRKAYGRGLRAARHIHSGPAAKFAAAGGYEVIIRSGDIKQACAVTVTLGPTSTFWAKAYQEIGPAEVGAEAGAAQQWAVSLFDLRVICDVIESPAQFIHYLRQRTSKDPETRELGADYIQTQGAGCNPPRPKPRQHTLRATAAGFPVPMKDEHRPCVEQYPVAINGRLMCGLAGRAAVGTVGGTTPERLRQR